VNGPRHPYNGKGTVPIQKIGRPFADADGQVHQLLERRPFRISRHEPGGARHKPGSDMAIGSNNIDDAESVVTLNLVGMIDEIFVIGDIGRRSKPKFRSPIDYFIKNLTIEKMNSLWKQFFAGQHNRIDVVSRLKQTGKRSNNVIPRCGIEIEDRSAAPHVY
jgi:hypothetical protein